MDVFQPLVVQARKARKVTLVVGAVIMAFGFGLLFIPAEDSDTTSGRMIMYAVVSFFVLCGAAVVYFGRKPAEQQPGIVALRESPGDICWAYVQRTRTNGQHTASALRLGLRNGKMWGVAVEKGREEYWLQQVMAVAPRAAFGFDPAIEARFKQDPTSVMKAAQS